MAEKTARQLKDEELAKLEAELNRDLDQKLAEKGDDLLWPPACNYIIPNEFGERFNFYGSKPLFSKYLARFYGLKSTETTVWTSMYNFLTYFLPLVGGALSDSYLGKFWTIIDLSIVYGIGTVLLALFSVPGVVPMVTSLSADEAAALVADGGVLPGPFGDNRVYQFWTFLLPMVLMALGIKPCVSAHGGDQYLPSQRKGLDFFFSIFYVAINCGALISGNSTPYMRMYLTCWGAPCYFSAYAMCSGVFIISMIIFALGHRVYRIVPPRGEFIPWQILKLTVEAAGLYFKASPEERKQKGNFLNFAIEKHGEELVEEARLIGNVFMLLLPIIFFWTVYDQGSNEWQYQYNMMYPSGIPVEAFGNLNSIMVILMVPALVPVYRFLERRGIRFTILQRVGTGYFLMVIAYGISYIMQIYVVESYKPGVNVEVIEKVPTCTDPKTCINSWWLFIQWFLLSLGESMMSPEGLKVTYMNVGPMMKSQSLSLWLLMSGLGSLFTLFVTKATENDPTYNDLTSFKAKNTQDNGISLPPKFALFGLCALAGNIWFVLWSHYVFKYKDEDFIGAGSVGSSIAYASLMRHSASEILLCDIATARCEAEVLDMTDAAFITNSKIRVGTFQECGQCDIVVITAGAKQNPGETRVQLIDRNFKILQSCITSMKPFKENTVLLLVANPVDVLTHIAQKLSGLPPSQVIGSGTFLDTARLRTALSKKLQVAETAIHAYILGEHGDSQFPAWSCAQTKLLDIPEVKSMDLDLLAQDVKNKAYKIIEAKGATYYGIGGCVSSLCESIFGNTLQVRPVSHYLAEYNVCLSMPAVLGSSGIVKTLPPALTEDERKKLASSASAMRVILEKYGF
ncbi:hypothetical protein EDD86DRAFT_250582 [Gorgonomyces haynaldii]|nr:hypothetical protein EDD86DRAFT_250582 [Gorgonomyces haynaldii]